ncbi:DUF6201 family protein [Plesiomonas sp. PI-19]|uniref:DUF6201 family protein n=1 Tax=Plesiomonas sp. PI-19 TaxID=2898798 RepID=UPI001F3E9B9A|nr:DUF6201 family protein [Plesiomonas sp. PI-19]MCE5163257.1 DUF6201 family protein [Plesiomonas sp. PI-19]
MKGVIKLLAVLCVIYWLLLAHVSLGFLDDAPPISKFSKDGRYKIVFEPVHPVNPIGLYCLLSVDWAPIYFVLYDSKVGYIGQSSPFSCYGAWRDITYRFPREEFTLDENSFVVFDDEYDGELNISTINKRWWSWWFGVFH